MKMFSQSHSSKWAILGLLLAGPFWARAEDWPQYRGPKFNGTTSEKIPKSWPDGGPRQVWKTPLNAGFSSFAVAGGQAYTLVLREMDGVKNEVCVALDAGTGKELWAI